MKKLILLRGVSGAGKSTIANLFLSLMGRRCAVHSADDFRVNADGEYEYNPDNNKYCHFACLEDTINSMIDEKELIIVHNTFTTEEQIEPYADEAKRRDYELVSLVVEKRHDSGNVHSTPKWAQVNQAFQIMNNLKVL